MKELIWVRKGKDAYVKVFRTGIGYAIESFIRKRKPRIIRCYTANYSTPKKSNYFSLIFK